MKAVVIVLFDGITVSRSTKKKKAVAAGGTLIFM